MGNFLGTLVNGLAGAATGFMTGGPLGAAAGGIGGLAAGGGPSGGGNLSPGTDPTIPISQQMNRAYELFNLGMQGEELRHQADMQIQSQQFNDVEDEKSEQMREVNSLRDVAMKQREADDKIVKEFIKSAGGE